MADAPTRFPIALAGRYRILREADAEPFLEGSSVDYPIERPGAGGAGDYGFTAGAARCASLRAS